MKKHAGKHDLEALVNRNLGWCFVFLICTTTVMADSPVDSWSVLKKLAPGQKIEIVEVSLKSHQGKFITVDDESISASIDGNATQYARKDVLRISLKKRSHRLRNALIGGTLGALAGWAAHPDHAGEGPVPVGLLIGVGVGALWPAGGKELIYQAP